MVLLHLSIENFRGVRELTWRVDGRLICLIGPGDSTKSTVLDAIDFALSPRWKLDLDDSDFYAGEASNEIKITATVGELPESFKADAKFGLDLRGWNKTTGLRDEPEEDDEVVLSVQLRVNSSLEPRWYVINDRNPDGRTISSQDRETLGIARIGDFLDRHLAWGRGSVLSRLTGKADDLSQILADATRAARGTLNPNSLPLFQAAADRVKTLGQAIGVVPKEKYQPHLDIQSVDVHTGGLTLHDGDIPVRRNGLGTRRLLTLALQQGLMDSGGIALIDEVEHGLEPHRLRRLLRALSRLDKSAEPGGLGYGQLLMTTHSEIVIDELDCAALRIVRSVNGKTEILAIPKDFQKGIRKAPEAFLGRTLIVCEGETEVGFCRALDAWWIQDGGHDPLSVGGVVPLDGRGAPAARYALSLATLGYPVAYFGDSDTPLNPDEHTLASGAVKVVCWASNLSLEQRLAVDLPWPGVQAVLQCGVDVCGEDKIRAAVIRTCGSPDGLKGPVSSWSDSSALRNGIGTAARDGSWFKRIDLGEKLGRAVTPYLAAIPRSDLAQKVASLRSWIDANG